MNTDFDRHGLFSRAVAFAAFAHDGQMRKGGALPYLIHPMEAATIAATLTNDPEILAAAVLHDVIEDCGVTEDTLRVRFGKRVAHLVRLQSEEKDEDRQGTWQKRKLQTINRLRAASREQMILTLSLRAAPRELLILTLADKLSNLRSIERDLQAHGPALWQRFNQNNPSMHRWYYASVAEALRPLEGAAAYEEYLRRLAETFPEG